LSELDPTTASKLSGIKTEILVAWIFALLVLIAWVGLFIFYFVFIFLILGLTWSCPMYYGYCYATNPYLTGFGLFMGIVLLVLMMPSILVFRRTNRMRGAANSGDIPLLKQLNSVGMAIVALIFTGVIPGIMLLVAHGPIEELGTQRAGGGMPSDSLDKLTKLKTLLDSGVITKDEYEAQKNTLLHPGVTRPTGVEDELRKLKTLYDSGVLTASEYEDQKKKALSRM
jgi:hypothetical protein